jgi:hypothetical protein
MGPFEFPKTLELGVVNPAISRKDLFVVTHVAMGTRDIKFSCGNSFELGQLMSIFASQILYYRVVLGQFLRRILELYR